MANISHLAGLIVLTFWGFGSVGNISGEDCYPPKCTPINCYFCDLKNGPRCHIQHDEFKPCAHLDKWGREYVTGTEKCTMNQSGPVIISRGCGFQKPGEKLGCSGKISEMTYCTCQSDLCKGLLLDFPAGSGALSASLAVLFFILHL